MNRGIQAGASLRVVQALVFVWVVVGFVACAPSSTQESVAQDGPWGQSCIVPNDEVISGGPGKDDIPALTDPELVGADGADYLRDDHRVIGFTVDGQAYAVPHNIMWWHEIVNFNEVGQRMTVTYCPLTGSPLAFERTAVDGAEFGVSGLLYKNNLVMYDRNDTESLWSQMRREGTCGPDRGTDLTMTPVIDMTWKGWRAMHPDTRVVSSDTGHPRDYTKHPYGSYEDLNNDKIYFPLPEPMDERRPPKERVLGIPTSDGGGIAFPFTVLGTDAPAQVATATADEQPVVVFWDGAKNAAMAFDPTHEGATLSFTVQDGVIVDTESGSMWRVDGRAISGPMEGVQLDAIDTAYVAFWFAWAAFQPDTEIWSPAG